MDVAVKGGEKSTRNAHRLLAKERGRDPKVEGQLLLVDAIASVRAG